MDHPTLAVDSSDLGALCRRFVRAANYGDLVVLADRDRPDVVLLSQFFGEWRAHQFPADVRRRREVGFAALTARGSSFGSFVTHSSYQMLN